MDTLRRPLIAGNWKMNLDHLQSIAFVQKLAWALKDANYQANEVEIGVFPPFTDLRSVQTLINADSLPFALGAQDLSMHDEGAHTGDISGAFLRALECEYVITGHSERRADHGETDEVVAAKTRAAIKHALVPIICVGGERGRSRTARCEQSSLRPTQGGLGLVSAHRYLCRGL